MEAIFLLLTPAETIFHVPCTAVSQWVRLETRSCVVSGNVPEPCQRRPTVVATAQQRNSSYVLCRRSRRLKNLPRHFSSVSKVQVSHHGGTGNLYSRQLCAKADSSTIPNLLEQCHCFRCCDAETNVCRKATVFRDGRTQVFQISTLPRPAERRSCRSPLWQIHWYDFALVHADLEVSLSVAII